MTKKEAKERAEVLLAFVEGKDIEYKLKGTMSWITCHQIRKDSSMSFNFEDYEYRIKKEPTYRPFKDKEECWAEMQKHQPFGWVKNVCGSYFFIYLVSINGYVMMNDIENKFTCAFDRITFVDGTPFGIKED